MTEDFKIRQLADRNGFQATKLRDGHLWRLVHKDTGYTASGLSGAEVRGIVSGVRSMSSGQGFSNPV